MNELDLLGTTTKTEEQAAMGEARKDLAQFIAQQSAPTKRSKLDGVGLTPAGAASLVTNGSTAGAALIEGMLPGEWNRERAEAVAAALRGRAGRLRVGDTSDVEDDLAAQLAWLSGLMAHAMRKGTAEGISPASAEVWMRLALKAQSAYARTVAAFAALNMTKPRTIND